MAPSRRLLATIPIVLGLVLGACSAPSSDEPGVGKPRTVQVNMSDELRYDPDSISASAGETVRFVVTNEGEAVHEFLIGDEAAQAEFAAEMADDDMAHGTDAGVSVEPGQTKTFDYTFGDADTELLAGCHEPGHYDAGMVAAITVTDPG